MADIPRIIIAKIIDSINPILITSCIFLENRLYIVYQIIQNIAINIAIFAISSDAKRLIHTSITLGTIASICSCISEEVFISSFGNVSDSEI